MESLVYWAASIAAALVLILVFRRFTSRRCRVSVQLKPYEDTSAGGGEKGFEVEVHNRGLSLTGLRVELYVCHRFVDAALSGMRGCRMKPVGTVPPEIKLGEAARFRLAERDLEQPTLLTTSEVRFSRYCLRELKDNEVAVLVYHSGDQLIKSTLIKTGISPEVLKRGRPASSDPERPLAAGPRKQPLGDVMPSGHKPSVYLRSHDGDQPGIPAGRDGGRPPRRD